MDSAVKLEGLGAGIAQEKGNDHQQQNSHKTGHHPQTAAALEFTGQMQPEQTCTGGKDGYDRQDILQHIQAKAGADQVQHEKDGCADQNQSHFAFHFTITVTFCHGASLRRFFLSVTIITHPF